MNETNEPRQPRDEDRIRRARAARRAKMRRRKRRQQMAALAGLIAFLALMIFLVSALVNKLTGSGETTPPSTAATEATTEPTVPTEPEPTMTPVTWMTFEADRQITAQQYFVYDVEAESFLTISGAPDETIYPASVTKLFTAYVALQYVQPDAVITATDALDLVAAGSSVAEISYGDRIKAEALVEAMLLPSGNDAACILAVEAGRILSGDQALSARSAADRFVAEMNSQAKALGMTGTNFANPDGIHRDSHYMTFADLAILGKLSLENPTIMKYANVARDTVTFENGVEKQWKNTNATIDTTSEYYCPYAIGLKTGQTPRAGSCLLSAFECNGRRLIIGVFGCPETEDRFADTLQLFNEAMGFEALPAGSVVGTTSDAASVTGS